MSAYPSYFERGPLALRPQLALDMLESRRLFSVDDVIALKHSTRMLLAERVKADVIEAARTTTDGTSDELASGAATLEAWDGTVAADSRGAVLFQRFWDSYSRAVASPFSVLWDESSFMSTPRGISDRPAAATHLAAAVRAVREQFGSERIAWGDVHRFRATNIDLPADGITGSYGAYRVITFEPLTGTAQRVAGHLPGRASPAGFGDAWILVVDFSRPATAWSVLAYGQTTRQDSPHSGDQMRLFAEHRLRRAWFTEADIKANLERSYRPIASQEIRRSAGNSRR
jgi:acyl-homoserine-lactone acylase